MKISRTRIAALGASALLILGGASVAFAQSPVPASPAPVDSAVEDPATGPDTDNIQEGDQSGPDQAGGAEDASGADTDTIEQGDQATPDTSALAAPVAQSAAKGVAVKAAPAATKAGASSKAELATKVESTPETDSSSESESSAESDGPGGHEDPAGQNVDHQFQGEE